MELLPLDGGLLMDPKAGVSYWLPTVPPTTNANLLHRKGYQPFVYDESLMLRLLTTFVPVKQFVHPEMPQSRYYAQPGALAFAAKVRVALALRGGAESDGIDMTRLLTTGVHPPKRVGEVGVVMTAKGFRIIGIEQLGEEQRLYQQRIQQVLEYLERLKPWEREYDTYQGFLQQYAQHLAEAYWTLSQMEQATEALSAPAASPSAEQAPPVLITPPQFEHGVARGVTPLPLEVIILALQDATSGGEHWDRSSIPSFHYEDARGAVTVLVPPVPHPSDAGEVLDFWQADSDPLPQFQDLDADNALLVVLLYVNAAEAEKTADGFIWVPPEILLQLRGRQPRYEHGIEVGQRTDERREYVESIERLSLLQVVGHHRVRGKRIEFETCQFILAPRRYYAMTQEGTHLRVLAIQVKPGDWFAPWLAIEAGRYLDIYVRQVFEFHLRHRMWEKRIARWLFFRLRLAAAEGRLSIRLSVGDLLALCALPINENHPDASRQRFELALRRLHEHQLISGCAYQLPEPGRGSKKGSGPRVEYPTTDPVSGCHFDHLQLKRSYDWLQEWKQWHIEISMGTVFMEHGYRALAQRRRKAAKELGEQAEEHQSDAEHQASTPRLK